MEQVASRSGDAVTGVSRDRRGGPTPLVITDRVYEHGYLRGILAGMFGRLGGLRIKSDNAVLNLSLLSLMLDFGAPPRVPKSTCQPGVLYEFSG